MGWCTHVVMGGQLSASIIQRSLGTRALGLQGAALCVGGLQLMQCALQLRLRRKVNFRQQQCSGSTACPPRTSKSSRSAETACKSLSAACARSCAAVSTSFSRAVRWASCNGSGA